MEPLPDALYTAAQVRAMDRALMAGGIPGIELMNRAGRAAFREAMRRWPEADRITVICGTGNNGGDGFVFARLAREAGCTVRVLLVGEAQRIRGDARLAWEAMGAAGVVAEPFAGDLGEAQLVVDALFGTGLDREVAGAHRAAIEAVNAQGAPVLALDLPSGLQADSGVVLGAAVAATLTVTFVALKRGMFTADGPDHCGAVVLDDLGAPAGFFADHPPSARLIRFPAAPLPRRRRNSHKGDFGHVLVVGGDAGMPGAARLAAEAALRSGAGLVTVATHPAHAPVLNLGRPELMVRPLESATDLADLLSRVTVVAVGPGLGRGAWGERAIRALAEWRGPLVVDADALGHLSDLVAVGDPERRIFTPHPGEAARLLGTTPGDVQRDRFRALDALTSLAPGHWLLKGCGTLVASPGVGSVRVCGEGNPGMASGGMGDVLTGVIAGLLAQAEACGWTVAEVVDLAVSLHARAGDRAAEDGERGLAASDLFPWIHRWVNA